jgi:hypothetical protein
MAIVTKIKDGDDQPNGGAGIVSMSSKGLSAADKIGADVSISPFPPHTAGQLDNSNDVTNTALNHKFDSDNVNFAPIGLGLAGGENATGVVVSAITGRSIEVVDYVIVAEKATTIEFLGGSTPLVSGVHLAANGGVSANSVDGLFETTQGVALQVSTSSGVIGGHISYRVV